MPFSIEQRESESILILALSGRFEAGEPVAAFRAEIERLVAEKRENLVLDFSEVEYIDSSALGCLVASYTKFTKAGGQMPLFGLNERGLELMVITKLSTVFRIFDNQLDAVNACFPGRTAKSFDVLDFVRQAREQRAARRGEGNP